MKSLVCSVGLIIYCLVVVPPAWAQREVQPPADNPLVVRSAEPQPGNNTPAPVAQEAKPKAKPLAATPPKPAAVQTRPEKKLAAKPTAAKPAVAKSAKPKENKVADRKDKKKPAVSKTAASQQPPKAARAKSAPTKVVKKTTPKGVIRASTIPGQ